MTTPAEFKAIKDLRQIDDQGISPDLLMLFESDTESLKVLLSQIASYIRKPLEDELIPPGVPQYWPGDTPPDGFAFINNGLTFNTVTYPKLALAWPTGVIPPHKGLVIECTADGAATGNTEQGDIKSHNHIGTVQNRNLGTVQTEFGGNHKHKASDDPSQDDGGFIVKIGTDGGEAYSGVGGSNVWLKDSTGEAGEHIHDLVLGEHDHGISIDNKGIARNTVDRINYNLMVRLA